MTDVYILIREDEYVQLVKSGNVDSTLMNPTTLHHTNKDGLSKEHPTSQKDHIVVPNKGAGGSEIKPVNTLKLGSNSFSSEIDSDKESTDSSVESENSDWFESWEGIHFKD